MSHQFTSTLAFWIRRECGIVITHNTTLRREDEMELFIMILEGEDTMASI